MKWSKKHKDSVPELDSFTFRGTEPVRSDPTPPCQLSCPNSGDIRKWIGFLAQREKLGLSKKEALGSAWGIIVDRNPFPASLGRICPHPCESGCNRTAKEAPVSIHAMERYLGDWAIEESLEFEMTEDPKTESVGIVGAGPAGLSFGYQMARRGYRVTIYESKSKPGGMLRFGIPDFRLPPKVLDAEIERIEKLGVEIRLGVEIGTHVSMDELRSDHEIVFVGIGAQTSRRLNIPGEEGPGCFGGTEFLAAVNTGEQPDIGVNVVVIGGGNTALDAARTARRLGADVTVSYRRSLEEMPANPVELQEAVEEGVRIMFLTSPTAVVRDESGNVIGVDLVAMELGEPDASGRASPRVIQGSNETIPASSVIVAVSQIPDAVKLGPEFVHPGDANESSNKKGELLLTGGDYLGLGIAGDAIVQGRKAAEAIHSRLNGVVVEHDYVDTTTPVDRLKLEHFESIDRTANRQTLVSSRLSSTTLQTLDTFTQAELFQEASRCMSCGSCFGCQSCYMYCNARCYTWAESPVPGKYFEFNLAACEQCSKCVEVCPSSHIGAA